VSSEGLKNTTKSLAQQVIQLVDAMPRSLAAQVIDKQSIVNRQSAIVNSSDSREDP
jgi:hypothetical protein